MDAGWDTGAAAPDAWSGGAAAGSDLGFGNILHWYSFCALFTFIFSVSSLIRNLPLGRLY